MIELYAQGDLLIERVADTAVSGIRISPDADGVVVLAEGELTGHRHVIYEAVQLYRDDGLARDMPEELYIGHLKIDCDEARVVHEEHAPVPLARGTYRLRRQRELHPRETRIVAD